HNLFLVEYLCDMHFWVSDFFKPSHIYIKHVYNIKPLSLSLHLSLSLSLSGIKIKKRSPNLLLASPVVKEVKQPNTTIKNNSNTLLFLIASKAMQNTTCHAMTFFKS
ncbi:hypothetical protein PanWU01x14_351140, partial [Parasponia andersonii]